MGSHVFKWKGVIPAPLPDTATSKRFIIFFLVNKCQYKYDDWNFNIQLYRNNEIIELLCSFYSR